MSRFFLAFMPHAVFLLVGYPSSFRLSLDSSEICRADGCYMASTFERARQKCKIDEQTTKSVFRKGLCQPRHYRFFYICK